MHLEWGVWDVLVIKLNRHHVLSWFCTGVGHSTGTILAILEVDLCLGWALHCNGETSCPSLTSEDVEVTWRGKSWGLDY